MHINKQSPLLLTLIFFFRGTEYSLYVGDLTSNVTDYMLLVSLLLTKTFTQSVHPQKHT